MTYEDIFDLPSLNAYYMVEVDAIGSVEVLPREFFCKILKRLFKAYTRDFLALPECHKIKRKARRLIFQQNKERLKKQAEEARKKSQSIANPVKAQSNDTT